jgi:glycosyltransferase involved in cell wall biosynthesis
MELGLSPKFHVSAPKHGVVVVHANGNENVRQVLHALTETDQLAMFATSLAWTRDNELPRAPHFIHAAASKRTFDMVESHQVLRMPLPEIVRNLLSGVPIRAVRRLSEVGQPFGIEWVSRALDAKVASRLGRDLNPRAVLGYQNKALRSFAKAKELGIGRVIEVTHAHWRMTQEIYDALEERSPEWATTTTVPSTRVRDEADAEIALAELVLSPSRQVTQSIQNVFPSAHIAEAPYGCPAVDPDVEAIRWDGKGKLKVIYVGRLQAGKGIADLAAMVRATRGFAELTVIGAAPTVPSAALADFLSGVRYLGTLPRGEVLQEMRRHHVFVLPSLVEGRSLAALEALSLGIPMLVTPGSGVDDLVEKGAGYVVEPASPDQLVQALGRFREAPELIETTSAKAIEIARHASWEVYRDRVAKLLRKAAILTE